MVDWTQVLLALIAASPGLLAAVIAYLNRRAIKTPSGDSLGKVMERTHDMTSADLALTKQVHETVTNGAH